MSHRLSSRVLFILLPLLLSPLNAQYRFSKTWDNPSFNTISIRAPWADKIVFHGSNNQQQIKLDYTTGGEYKSTTVLGVKLIEKTKTLTIEEKKVRTNALPKDKISVHKHLATSLTISMPHNLSFFLAANHSLVLGSGKLQQLDISLANGTCKLHRYSSNGHIRTKHANVVLLNSPAVQVNAQSAHGKITINRAATHQNSTLPVLNITSVNGNIDHY